MKKYFTIESNPMINNNNKIRLGQIPDSIDSRAYLLDEWQYLNDEKSFIEFQKMGQELPDVYTYNIPLISSRIKEALDEAGVSNTFYKPIYLYEKADMEKIEQYYLMLVEALDCVIWEESNYTECNFSGLKKISGAFTIDTSKVGNFKIFKVRGIQNRFWLISEDIKEKFENLGVKGAKILKPDCYFGV
jgi:hypothetical protein